MKKIIYLHLGLLFFALVLVAKIQAAAIELSVSPANAYVQISGGEEQFLEYHLLNESSQLLTVKLSAQSFMPDNESGQPLLLERLDFPYFSLYESSVSAAPTVDLPPQSDKKVLVRLNPPLGITEKEYPVTLFFEVVAGQDTTGSVIVPKIGSNLIVLTDKSNFDKSDLRIAAPVLTSVIDSFFIAPLRVKIYNEGATATLINGQLTLKRADGRVVQTWDFYPDLILGKSARVARGKSETTLLNDFTLARPLFGSYILEGKVMSGHQQSDLAQKQFVVEFFAFPLALTKIILIFVVIIVIINLVLRGKRPAKQLQQKNDKLKRRRAHFS